MVPAPWPLRFLLVSVINRATLSDQATDWSVSASPSRSRCRADLTMCHARVCFWAQTENGYLLVYDLHVTKQPAIPALRSQSWGTHDSLQQLHAVDVYVKHPVRCDREVPATCVCCDSRTILVAYADGYWGSCSWFGKVRCSWLMLGLRHTFFSAAADAGGRMFIFMCGTARLCRRTAAPCEAVDITGI